MKTLQELDLHVPHLGVKQTCQTIGGQSSEYDENGWGGQGVGYDWDEGSNGDYTHNESDWGDIPPAYCYPDHSSDWDDCSGPSWSTPDSCERDDFGGWGGGDSYSSNSDSGESSGSNSGSGSEEVGHDGYYLDTNMNAKDAEIIYASMGDLPEEFQNYDTMIIADSELLAMINEEANGCFLHKGQVVTLTDGTKYTAEQDTVLIRNSWDITEGSVESVLKEEFCHNWQHENCIRDGVILTHPLVQSMEFQVSVLSCINDWAEGKLNSSLDGNNTIYGILMNACDEQGNISSSNVANALNSITYSQWKEISEEWSDIYEYPLDTTNYEWNWESIIRLMLR